MRSTNILAFIIIHLIYILLQMLCSSSAQECSNLIQQTILCRNVGSMHELANKMQPNWTHLIIINRPGSTFTITEHTNPNLEYISNLDLSKSGRLQLSDHGFKNFAGLKILNLSNTKLTHMQLSWFSDGNTLEELDISENMLTTIARHYFQQLSAIQMINASYNKIEQILPKTFSGLMNLREIILHNNELTTIPEDIGILPKLLKLDLSDNAIDEIKSNSFKTLTSLTDLSLAQNGITTIEPEAFNGLSELKLLNISGNSIKIISSDFFSGMNRNQLEYLDLNSNDIETLGNGSFSIFRSLKDLDVSRNNIREIDGTTFNGLRSLKRLYLYDNDILNMQENSFAIPLLDYLDLSGNSVQSFGPNLFGSSNCPIRKLFIKRNNLQVIQPHAFDYARNIDYLSVPNNVIRTIDENVFSPLLRLKKLHLGHNLLEELPVKLIEKLSGLREFIFDHNRLTYLPDLNNLFRNLKHVAFEGNPWQCSCLELLVEFVNSKHIEYFNENQINPYFNGSRPICVAASNSKECIRDRSRVQELHILELYENPFAV